jgi:hypothetical protein
MNVYDWDFSKLPESEHSRVIELFDEGEWEELNKVHNEYGLSKNLYCCASLKKAMYNWFYYGIESGQISANEEG